MGVSAIRDGLAAALDTITSLRTADLVRDSIVVPCAVIGPPEIDFDSTFARGKDRYTFPVRLYASRASERTGQDVIDGFLAKSGAGSAKAAIEADPTLGGACDTLRVLRASGYGAYTIAGIDYLGVELTVEVYA